MEWHLGSVIRESMDVVPGDRPAVIDALTGQSLDWAALKRRSENICAGLQARGISRGDKVAIYARNGIAYVEAALAVLQIGAVHVNVNFRYTADELLHIFSNSDAKAVFFQDEFADRLENIADRLPELSVYIRIAGPDKPHETGLAFQSAQSETVEMDSLAETPAAENLPDYATHPDDRFFMYTGGTTGLPKGAMWTQNKLFKMICINYFAEGGPRQPETPEDVRRMIENGEHYTEMVIAPMMHGMGIYSVLPTLVFGGTVVTSSATGFDAAHVWQSIGKYNVNAMKLPGDAMGKPLLEALEAGHEKIGKDWQLDKFVLLISSAAVFSNHIKRRLVGLLPHLTINDILGGSESAALGHAVTTASDNKDEEKNKDADAQALKLTINEFVRVFTEDHKEVRPGSGEIGMVARSGLIADGYYKDPERSARTFPVIDGQRYCLLGDWAEVLADGTIKFLGRGNVCINTGGEKVFPEEVEQSLKVLPDIDDCCVVGVADTRWGSAVTALVQLVEGEGELDVAATVAALRDRLAGYKIPKTFIVVKDIGRAPNGKLDYASMKQLAADALRPHDADNRPELIIL